MKKGKDVCVLLLCVCAGQHETERLGWTDSDSPRCVLGKSSIMWSDKEQKEPISAHVISSFSSRFLVLVNRTLNWCLLNWMSGSREDFVTFDVGVCKCSILSFKCSDKIYWCLGVTVLQ